MNDLKKELMDILNELEADSDTKSVLSKDEADELNHELVRSHDRARHASWEDTVRELEIDETALPE